MKTLGNFITICMAIPSYILRALLISIFTIVLIIFMLSAVLLVIMERLILKEEEADNNYSIDDTVTESMRRIYSKRFWKTKRYQVIAMRGERVIKD